MRTVRDYLKFCEKTLKGCGIETYRSDCLFLIAHLQGMKPSLLALEEGKPFKEPERLKELLKKRCEERLSVAHLIGEWDCLGRTFKVFPKVLAPRAATELLLETAIYTLEETFGRKKPLVGLEVGTGTGCISVNLLLEFPELRMVGVEIDPVAAENTLENAKLYGVADRLELIEGDIFEKCPRLAREGFRFDFVISNPPYIALRDAENLPPEVRNENPLALFGGEDGTLFHRYFAENCPSVLKKGGLLFLEFEPFQKEKLERYFKNWKTRFVEDFAGNPRVLIAELKT